MTSAHSASVISLGYLSPRRSASRRCVAFHIGTPCESVPSNELQPIHPTQVLSGWVLTGLPNRTALLAKLEDQINKQRLDGSAFGLIYLDLDHFKQVNDAFGHREGDRLLRIVAQAIRSSTRGEDLAARLGGDEFAVLLKNCDAEECSRAAERIQTAVNCRLEENGVRVTASVGTVTYHVVPASAEAALNDADIAMYAAKSAGRNTIRHIDNVFGTSIWPDQDF